jgi:hypothetical protein
VAQLCERPGCANPATVAYGFDAGQRLAWLQPRTDDATGSLCRRHADAMQVPRGWLLDDRRVEPPRLFAPPPEAPVARRPRRTGARRPSAPVAEPSLLEATGADELADATPGTWSPVAVARNDLADALDATTPLLARAFGVPRPAADAAG